MFHSFLFTGKISLHPTQLLILKCWSVNIYKLKWLLSQRRALSLSFFPSLLSSFFSQGKYPGKPSSASGLSFLSPLLAFLTSSLCSKPRTIYHSLSHSLFWGWLPACIKSNLKLFFSELNHSFVLFPSCTSVPASSLTSFPPPIFHLNPLFQIYICYSTQFGPSEANRYSTILH